MSTQSEICDALALKLTKSLCDSPNHGMTIVDYDLLAEVVLEAKRNLKKNVFVVVIDDNEVETIDGIKIPVTGKPLIIIREIALHYSISRQSLIDSVWGRNDVVEETTINSTISRARAILRKHGIDIACEGCRYSFKEKSQKFKNCRKH